MLVRVLAPHERPQIRPLPRLHARTPQLRSLNRRVRDIEADHRHGRLRSVRLRGPRLHVHAAPRGRRVPNGPLVPRHERESRQNGRLSPVPRVTTRDVWRIMRDNKPRSLVEIVAQLQNGTTASVGARVRDLRKPAFGSHVVLRSRGADGVHRYTFISRSTWDRTHTVEASSSSQKTRPNTIGLPYREEHNIEKKVKERRDDESTTPGNPPPPENRGREGSDDADSHETTTTA